MESLDVPGGAGNINGSEPIARIGSFDLPNESLPDAFGVVATAAAVVDLRCFLQYCVIWLDQLGVPCLRCNLAGAGALQKIESLKCFADTAASRQKAVITQN